MLLGVAALAALLSVVLIGMLLRLAAQSRSMSVTLGIENGRLRDCPATPNCVSSDAPAADSHYIAPIADPGGEKWAALVATVGAIEGASLVGSTERYAHFTFTSQRLRFVDDVEFQYRPDVGEIAGPVSLAGRPGRHEREPEPRRVDPRVALAQAHRAGQLAGHSLTMAAASGRGRSLGACAGVPIWMKPAMSVSAVWPSASRTSA